MLNDLSEMMLDCIDSRQNRGLNIRSLPLSCENQSDMFSLEDSLFLSTVSCFPVVLCVMSKIKVRLLCCMISFVFDVFAYY